MADLSDLTAAQTVKIVGCDSAGLEQTPVESSSDGELKTINPAIGTNDGVEPSKSILVSGSDGSNLRPLLTDSQGRLVTSAITGFGANFTFGDITTAATTTVAVRRTTYNEQTTNAQRSISSSSANDSSAGTGARTVRIVYLTSTGSGPFTETITLNGTTPVNTVATNICFIEQIDVLTVGSTGSNVGTITLFVSTAGGGGPIGTIAPTQNQTFWSHHYVPLSKECNITGMAVSHSGTTVGSGGVFSIRSQPIPSANQVDFQVSDFVRLYGQSSNIIRTYGSPIKITGPARLTSFVSPETSTSTVYRASIDFFEP